MYMNKNNFHDDKDVSNHNEKFENDEYNIVSAIFLIREGLIRDCNPKFAEILGYEVGEIVDRKGIQEFIFLDDKQKFEQTLSTFMVSHLKSTQEIVKIMKKNNSVANAKIYLSKTLCEGNPSIIGSLIEISENKTTAAPLNILAQAINNISEGLILTDLDRTIFYVNETLTRTLGFSSEELLGKNINVLLEECIDQNNLQKIINQKQTNNWQCELICMRKDGTHFLTILKNSLITNKKNFPIAELFTLEDISEKDRMMGELRRSEYKYRNLFEKMHDAFAFIKIVTDGENKPTDMILLEANKGFEKLIQEPAKALIGQSLLLKFDMLKNIEHDPFRIIANVALNRKEERFEHKVKSSNRWYSVSIYSPERAFAFIIIHDITEEKKAQEESNQSKMMLSSILDNIPQRVFWKDTNSTYLGCNIHFAKDLGLNDASEIIGKSEYDLNSHELAERYIANDKFIIESGESINSLEYEYHLQNKNKIWIRLNKMPLRNYDEKIIGTVGTYEDISKEKKIHENLSKLSQAVEQSPASIIITDLNGNIEYVNQKFSTITGYSFQEVIGKNPRILKSGEMSAQAYQELWQTINLGKEWTGEFHNKKKNGELYWEGASISPIKDNNGVITHYLAVKEDITSYKKFEQELRDAKEKAEEANRLKSFFLANISHELRTPLVGILGYSETLFNEIENPEFKEMAHILLKSGTRLKETLNLILDLSHIEGDKLDVNLSRQNLTVVVREKFKQFHSAAIEKGLRFRLVLGEDDIMIKADERMLSQLIEHLLANAIKYTNQGDITVTISKILENQKQFAQIKVKDTGIGIPRQSSRLIFEPFRQASEGLSRSFEGLGLGLTVAKKFIEMMGGEISVESDVGKGSEFTVKFPIYSQDDFNFPKDFSHEKLLDEQIIHNYKYSSEVLLIEDDEPTANIARFYLSETCKTDWACNAKTAISMAEKKNYSAILVDINLGFGMDGIEAINLIKKIKGYVSIPIIAVTAYALYGDREKFLNQGCTHYISKPFGKNDIVALLDKVLIAQH